MHHNIRKKYISLRYTANEPFFSVMNAFYKNKNVYCCNTQMEMDCLLVKPQCSSKRRLGELWQDPDTFQEVTIVCFDSNALTQVV